MGELYFVTEKPRKYKGYSMQNSLESNRIAQYFSTSRSHQANISISIGMIFVITVYIWFVSFGLWTKWNGTSDYYDQLATAFTHGSLSLEKQVNPALLSLENPYNPAERKGISYPLDFSLYKGKYYLYFGPTPALLLAIFKLFGARNVGDQYLVFIFISGIFIFQSLLLVELRKQFFQNIPNWLLLICIIFGGLIFPLTWMLTEARVYEVSDASGQFFFLAGLYFNIYALRKNSPVPGQFLIGSSLWAFSIGARITEALPIGFLALMTTLLYVNNSLKTKSMTKNIYSIASLAIPLIIGVAILGWYNWARFDSVFETGFSYELTSTYLQKYRQELFLPAYILSNLYAYWVSPPKILAIFPFFDPVRGKGYLLFPSIVLPKIYNTARMAGILINIPFVLFAGVSTISILFPKMEIEIKDNNPNYLLKWMITGLLGAFLLGFAPIVSYFWVAPRYLADFSPSLVLLSIIGFWLGYNFLSRWSIGQKIYVSIGICLMVVSVVISNLLVFSMRELIYQAVNPILWDQLHNLFTIHLHNLFSIHRSK
jgi:hypothetical protein